MATTCASCVEVVDDVTNSLLPLEGSTSEVWKHFSFAAKNGKYIEDDKKKRTKVCCKLCNKSLKYSGNTSNLRAHLERPQKRFSGAIEAEKEKLKASGSAKNFKQPTVVETLNGLTPISQGSN